MQNLYFFKDVPSYFTRILVGNLTLEQMKETYEFEKRENVNFIYKDGVTTDYVVNDLTFRPNYLIVEDGTEISRWFVLDDDLTRKKQMHLMLKRDSITDNYLKVLNAPIYLQKCMLNANNPLIFNNENMAFNQIKKEETLLKDYTDTGWIIGYLAPSNTDRTITFTKQNDPSVIDLHEINRADWEYNSYSTGADKIKTFSEDGIQYSLQFARVEPQGATPRRYFQRTFNYRGKQLLGYGSEIPTEIGYTYPLEEINGYLLQDNSYNSLINNSQAQNIPSWISYASLRNYLSSEFGVEYNAANPLLQFNQKKIRFADGFYYVNVVKETRAYSNTNDMVAANIIGNELVNHFDFVILGTGPAINEYSCHSSIVADEYSLVLTPFYDEQSLSVTIPATANKLNDQPYIMFALPSMEFTITTSGGEITQEEGLSFLLARAISEALSGAGALYDLQYLPYAPTAHPDNLTGLEEKTDYAYIKSGNQNVGVMYFATNSTFEVDLNYSVSANYTDNIDFKVKSQTRFIRLVSPNQQGTFEMNQYKNRGIERFTAKCTYKPYIPFIYIEPEFKSLYGSEFNDGRGLICAGDFSLPQISDAFQTYALQNKNYINSFNRSIENMDVNYELNRKEALISGLSQGFGASIGAGTTGAILGGPVGAAVGAVGTGLANGVALGLDMKMMEKRFNESRDYAIDQFNYSLQNIKARPDSLSKVGSVDSIFKVWPVLEMYEATEQEEAALRNKIKYNGMTAMFISTIDQINIDQKGYFLQGQLIRMDADVDNHMTSDIAEELKKGVFWN